MIRDIDLDHVAVAAERQSDAWPRYAGDLAGAWVAGGSSVGFSSAQVRYGNGMKVEVLEPHLVAQNDFLRRFLDTTGPGAHHLTFKVADLGVALDEVGAAGLEPVGVDRSDPGWQEAFLHPKQVGGVVVQLAQSDDGDWGGPAPDGFPAPAAPPAVLDHVTHVVADLDDAAAVWQHLLGGHPEDEGEEGGGHHLDLAWPGPGRVRLLAPEGAGSPLWGWLDGRPGRVHHLAFTVTDPGAVPGAVAADDGTWVVPPDANLGVRLVLSARG